MVNFHLLLCQEVYNEKKNTLGGENRLKRKEYYFHLTATARVFREADKYCSRSGCGSKVG